MKGHEREVEGAGAVGRNEKGWGENRRKGSENEGVI